MDTNVSNTSVVTNPTMVDPRNWVIPKLTILTDKPSCDWQKPFETPLGQKLPIVPGNRTQLYTTPIGYQLYQPTCDFDRAFTTEGYISTDYNFFHDIHLRDYFKQRPKLLELCRKLGQVTRDNHVACSVKEYNNYTQYMQYLSIDCINKLYRRRAEKEQKIEKNLYRAEIIRRQLATSNRIARRCQQAGENRRKMEIAMFKRHQKYMEQQQADEVRRFHERKAIEKSRQEVEYLRTRQREQRQQKRMRMAMEDRMMRDELLKYKQEELKYRAAELAETEKKLAIEHERKMVQRYHAKKKFHDDSMKELHFMLIEKSQQKQSAVEWWRKYFRDCARRQYTKLEESANRKREERQKLHEGKRELLLARGCTSFTCWVIGGDIGLQYGDIEARASMALARQMSIQGLSKTHVSAQILGFLGVKTEESDRRMMAEDEEEDDWWEFDENLVRLAKSSTSAEAHRICTTLITKTRMKMESDILNDLTPIIVRQFHRITQQLLTQLRYARDSCKANFFEGKHAPDAVVDNAEEDEEFHQVDEIIRALANLEKDEDEARASYMDIASQQSADSLAAGASHTMFGADIGRTLSRVSNVGSQMQLGMRGSQAQIQHMASERNAHVQLPAVPVNEKTPDPALKQAAAGTSQTKSAKSISFIAPSPHPPPKQSVAAKRSRRKVTSDSSESTLFSTTSSSSNVNAVVEMQKMNRNISLLATDILCDVLEDTYHPLSESEDSGDDDSRMKNVCLISPAISLLAMHIMRTALEDVALSLLDVRDATAKDKHGQDGELTTNLMAKLSGSDLGQVEDKLSMLAVALVQNILDGKALPKVDRVHEEHDTSSQESLNQQIQEGMISALTEITKLNTRKVVEKDVLHAVTDVSEMGLHYAEQALALSRKQSAMLNAAAEDTTFSEETASPVNSGLTRTMNRNMALLATELVDQCLASDVLPTQEELEQALRFGVVHIVADAIATLIATRLERAFIRRGYNVQKYKLFRRCLTVIGSLLCINLEWRRPRIESVIRQSNLKQNTDRKKLRAKFDKDYPISKPHKSVSDPQPDQRKQTKLRTAYSAIVPQKGGKSQSRARTDMPTIFESEARLAEVPSSEGVEKPETKKMRKEASQAQLLRRCMSYSLDKKSSNFDWKRQLNTFVSEQTIAEAIAQRKVNATLKKLSEANANEAKTVPSADIVVSAPDQEKKPDESQQPSPVGWLSGGGGLYMKRYHESSDEDSGASSCFNKLSGCVMQGALKDAATNLIAQDGCAGCEACTNKEAVTPSPIEPVDGGGKTSHTSSEPTSSLEPLSSKVVASALTDAACTVQHDEGCTGCAACIDQQLPYSDESMLSINPLCAAVVEAALKIAGTESEDPKATKEGEEQGIPHTASNDTTAALDSLPSDSESFTPTITSPIAAASHTDGPRIKDSEAGLSVGGADGDDSDPNTVSGDKADVRRNSNDRRSRDDDSDRSISSDYSSIVTDITLSPSCRLKTPTRKILQNTRDSGQQKRTGDKKVNQEVPIPPSKSQFSQSSLLARILNESMDDSDEPLKKTAETFQEDLEQNMSEKTYVPDWHTVKPPAKGCQNRTTRRNKMTRPAARTRRAVHLHHHQPLRTIPEAPAQASADGAAGAAEQRRRSSARPRRRNHQIDVLLQQRQEPRPSTGIDGGGGPGTQQKQPRPPSSQRERPCTFGRVNSRTKRVYMM